MTHLSLYISFLWLIGVVSVDAQTLKILSERRNAYAINGNVLQNNTITVQCTDADFGVYRLATITKADGSTVQLAVLCSPPVYTYSLEQVGVVPRDTNLDILVSCRSADSLKLDTTTAQQLLERTSASGVIGNSLQRRKAIHESGRLPRSRKAFGAKVKAGLKIAAYVGLTALIGFGGGIAGGYEYCRSIGGCAKQSDLEKLERDVTKLDGTVTRLDDALTDFEGKFVDLTNNYTRLFAQTETRFETVQAWVNNSLATTSASLTFMNGTNEYLRQQSQNLTNEFRRLDNQSAATDARVAELAATLSQGISGVNAALTSYIAQMNNVTANLSAQFQTASGISSREITQLKQQVLRSTNNLQWKITSLQQEIVHTVERRILAAFMQERVVQALANDLTPFTLDLGRTPAGASDSSLWRTLLEAQRILYIRDNLGLTAQMIDVEYYCDTQSLIDIQSGLGSYEDFLSAIGPVGCNATLRQGCRCWVTTQRSSCSTSNERVTAGTWLQNTTIWAGSPTAVCSGSITTGAVATHTTLPSFLSVMADVCNDGTFANSSNHRVISGQLSREATVGYNPLACSMALDAVMSLSSTGNSFIATMLVYLMLVFPIVQSNANQYSKIVYGQTPSGITTTSDPLMVVNGTESRCMTSGMVSYDLNGGMLPVYRLRFVSATSSVTVKLDNVISNVVTDVTISVPGTVALPDTDTAVVGNPSDASELWNIPNSELSLSPVAKSREGHITYPMMDSLGNFTMAKWETVYGVTFDHFAGAASAAYYYRTINGSGLCAGNSLPGEGPWCTARQQFNIAAVSGGITLTPRAGTGATVIPQLIVPDGTITSVIFSECPTISINQENPEVATLLLGNARPDVDITVAIVLGGQCSATVSSFTIGRLSSRPYLIPQCLSSVDSTRSVTVYRYDSESNLVKCGNTTNVTISRDVFIRTYSTPDLLRINTTRQQTQDTLYISMLNSSRRQADIMLDIITSIPAIFRTFGVNIPPIVIYNLTQYVDAIRDQEEKLARAANESRNRATEDFNNLYNQFAPQMNDAISQAAAANARAKALLDQLAGENDNATSILADVIAASLAAQNSLANVTAALKAFANATAAVAVATLNALSEMNRDNGDLNPFFDFFGDVISGTGNVINGAVNGVIRLAGKGVGLAEDILETGLGLPAMALKGLMWAGIALIGLLVGGAILFLSFKPLRRWVARQWHGSPEEMSLEDAKHFVARYNKAFAMVRANAAAEAAAPVMDLPTLQNPTAPSVTPSSTPAPAPLAGMVTTGSKADRAKWLSVARSALSGRPSPSATTAVALPSDARPLLPSSSSRNSSQPTVLKTPDDRL